MREWQLYLFKLLLDSLQTSDMVPVYRSVVYDDVRASLGRRHNAMKGFQQVVLADLTYHFTILQQ